jgi:conjugative transposon TraK protein
MFSQLKNIDSAFKHIRSFSIFMILACMLISIFIVWTSHRIIQLSQQRIYILANGKVLQAFSSDRKENLEVESKDHIRMFHHWFFTLDPDDKVIKENLSKALYLADESARHAYENLKEEGYYANVISANISQEIRIDSIHLDLDQYPYYFKCFATQKLIRSSAGINRSLITEGYLRNVSRSDNNPHGFLIQKWETLVNADLKTLEQ